VAQLDVAGGGGSFEWLEDEPGFDAPADVGFFTLIMTATSIMNIIIMKNMVLGWTVLGPAAVRPKASACVSKHCVPVHTVWRFRVSITSWTPGRCG